MRDKPGWLNWFWQFLCKGLSSFNMKGFYYSYAQSRSLCEGRTSFYLGLISGKLCKFSTVFTSLSVLLVFPLSPSSSSCMVFDSISSYMRFSWSTHLLMSLSFKALMSIISAGWPILVAPILIDLVNSVNVSLFQMTLIRWLTFLLRSQTKILTVLLFWTYYFLLLLVFVLQWLSILWEILIKFLAHFPLIFH